MFSKILYRPFFLYFIILKYTLASSSFILLFFKISFEKSIQLPTSLFKDSSMRIDISFSALLWLILAKSDAKLLKQQLFNDFWRYLRIGASIWNLNDFTHFEFPIGTWNILNVLLSCVSSWLWKVSYINQSHKC